MHLGAGSLAALWIAEAVTQAGAAEASSRQTPRAQPFLSKILNRIARIKKPDPAAPSRIRNKTITSRRHMAFVTESCAGFR